MLTHQDDELYLHLAVSEQESSLCERSSGPSFNLEYSEVPRVHGMVGVGRVPWRSSSPIGLLKKVHLEQAG